MATSRVITEHVIRQRRKVAAALGWMAGIVTLSSVYGYRVAYPHYPDRLRLSTSFSHDAGIAAVVGPARALDTVAGFTAFRTLGVIPLIVAIWAMLSATRGLRGEEESGRWEILIAAPITKRRATLATIRGLYGSLVITLVVSSLFITLTSLLSHDFTVRAGLFFALTLIATAFLFTSVGALASQIASTRRLAATQAGLILGISFLLRAVADSSPNLSWLHWLSPLGWITESAPLTHTRWLGLGLTLFTTIVLTGLTVMLSSRRDLGASLVPERMSDRDGTKITGTFSLWLKLQRATIASWMAGFFFMSFAFGLVAHGATTAFGSSAGIQKVFATLGISKMSELFFGVIFMILTSALMFSAVGQSSALREQETEGYLDHILVAPVSRTRALLSRIAVSAASLVAIAVCAGFGAFSGSSLRNGTLSLKEALLASLNTVPSALLIFGFTIAVFGIAPRATTVVGQSLLAWSFLMELIGSSLKLNHWLLDTSFLHHMTFAPAAEPRWGQNVLLAAIGLALIGVGIIAFNRRDTEIG
jgi:ABC-2 type transport system permease protein